MLGYLAGWVFYLTFTLCVARIGKIVLRNYYMEIISRADAHKKGLQHFFTGKPCKRNHLRERSVKTGACLDCLAHYARQYTAKYRAKSNADASGMVEHSVRIHAEHAPLVDQFVRLCVTAKSAGTTAPMVPPPEHVPAVNTMIQMLHPAASAPQPVVSMPTPPQLDLSDADARYAMWVRIHGKDIADQMAGRG